MPFIYTNEWRISDLVRNEKIAQQNCMIECMTHLYHCDWRWHEKETIMHPFEGSFKKILLVYYMHIRICDLSSWSVKMWKFDRSHPNLLITSSKSLLKLWRDIRSSSSMAAGDAETLSPPLCWVRSQEGDSSDLQRGYRMWQGAMKGLVEWLVWLMDKEGLHIEIKPEEKGKRRGQDICETISMRVETSDPSACGKLDWCAHVL